MFIDRENIEIRAEDSGYVRVRRADGTEIKNVQLKRLFPLSRANSFIQMKTPDGKEAGIIKSLNELKPESRRNAKVALDRFYIMPKITEIYDLYDAHGSLFWHVETDRGSRNFTVRSRHRDITVFPSGKLIIRDTDDNQYEITNCDELPPKSRKLLEPWL